VNFQQAVQQTPEIREAWQPGLQALAEADRRRIGADDTRALTGSVDLDGFLADRYPDKYANQNRWDYGIGHRPPGKPHDKVYWVEVHPATPGEVRGVLKKLAWLRGWLSSAQSPLNQLRQEFIWISSGRTSGSLSAPTRRRLAHRHGLLHTGKHFRIC
jgi:hypothetical protein